MENQNTYCVYMHVNKINGKKYVGMTKHGNEPDKRWGKNGSGYLNGRSKIFGDDILKYGWHNFEHIILENNLSYEEARKSESNYILKYKSYEIEYGYNYAIGNSLPCNKNPMYGKTHTEETRKKFSNIHKNNKYCVGRILSNETKSKISNSIKAKQHGENHPFYGKKHTDETKKKLSQKNKGNKNPMHGKSCKDYMTEEQVKKWKENISKANKGKNLGEKSPVSKKYNIIYKNIEYNFNCRNDFYNFFKTNYNINIINWTKGRIPKKYINDIELLKSGDKIVYKNV